MRRPVMAGNWKMYKNAAETNAFFEKFRPLAAASTHCDVVICPPFVSLPAACAAARGTRIEIGGQNMFWEKEGAYTGEISGSMLKSAGCQWVLIAHSERRQYFGETDESAAKKITAALDADLTPVYCVGESLQEREAGRCFEVLTRHVHSGLAKLTPQQFTRLVLAYEPVWAIGTGKVATPDLAAEAHRFIRDQIKTLFGPDAAAACRILYGGSVKPDNIRGLMAQPEIDGALVGGASLDPVSFASIVNF
ncbi:MAG: triose-phosphate isomerase [Acidobacteriota bacterium]|nr:triose-phosphate isomerase [Acidobacteriota bacterium]